jgi:hypothetical protein
MAASVEAYIDLVREAHDGRLKLPAFQRDWKWATTQVTLLFDSLRQKYPFGSFLVLNEGEKVNLSPREFHGSHSGAREKTPSRLVLDGQQRLTAGIEFFFGTGTRHYFIDILKLEDLFCSGEYDLDNRESIRQFLSNLEADDGYCVSRPAKGDPERHLTTRGWLWTGYLLEDDNLSRAIKKISSSKSELIC